MLQTVDNILELYEIFTNGNNDISGMDAIENGEPYGVVGLIENAQSAFSSL